MNEFILRELRNRGIKIVYVGYYDYLCKYYDSDLHDCDCYLDNINEAMSLSDLIFEDIDGGAQDSAYYITGGDKKYLFIDCSERFICNILLS